MSGLTIGPATRDDSAIIADLFLISSDGLAEYIWSQVAEPGETPLAAGARRYARPDVAFSYQNCLVAKEGRRVIAMAHSFPMDCDPAATADSDPVLRPYAELEDDGSLYLSGIAVIAGHRSQGTGTRLMAAVEERAQALARPRISLICFEGNVNAMRWYRRLGFEERDRRPIVPHPLLHYADGDAVLLVRSLG